MYMYIYIDMDIYIRSLPPSLPLSLSRIRVNPPRLSFQVLAALGDARLAAMLPELIEGARSPSVVAREGHAALWHHLPRVLGARFEPHLSAVLPLVRSICIFLS